MIKSGIPKIDDLLNKSFHGGFVADIFGPPATGKTQLLFHICANAIADGSQVLFLDIKGEFRPERILEILGSDHGERQLENIRVLRVTNTKEQISSISKIDSDYSVILVDNITELFSFEYGKSGQGLERNKVFMKYMNDLSRTAIENKIPIIFTNTIRTIDEKEIESLQKATSPFTHVRIHLAKNNESVRGVLYTMNKKEEFSFDVTDRGIVSAS